MRNLIQVFEKLSYRPDENLGILENKLHSIMDPVTPNPDFVKNLRYHLLSQWGTIPTLPSSNTPLYLLMVLAIIFSGIMFIVVSVRLILVLGSLITFINNWRRKSAGNSLVSSQP